MIAFTGVSVPDDHWRRQLWALGLGHVPLLDFQLFIIFQVTSDSLQSLTNSDIQLSVVAYPVKIYWPIVLSPFIASI